jgi:hypothetical protein
MSFVQVGGGTGPLAEQCDNVTFWQQLTAVANG